MLGALSVTQARANVAEDLTKNYNTVVGDCGSAGRPSFLCSGVMIRGATLSDKYHVWDPSPRSIRQGGVSFSYVRKDVRLTQLMTSFSSGIIFYPSSLKPTDKDQEEVLCSFPLDGATDGRSGLGGCGPHVSYPANSGECQSQGIYNVDTWIAQYTSIPENGVNRRTHQCGFNVSIGTPNSSTIFVESLKSQQRVFNGSLAWVNNEIVVKTWSTDADGKTINPEKLPIQAFFYTNEDGLTAAKYYQKDYYNHSGVIVPIVKVTFPQNYNQDIVFTYSEADQNKQHCTLD